MPYNTAFPAQPGWESVELYVVVMHTGELVKYEDWEARWGGMDMRPLEKPKGVVVHRFPIVGWGWEEMSMEAVPVYEQPDVDEDGRIQPDGTVRLIHIGPLHGTYESVEALTKAFGNEVTGMWTKYMMGKDQQ